MDVVKRVAGADVETLDLLDQAMRRPEGGDKRSEEYKTTADNVSSDGRPGGARPAQGNSSSRALRKLRSDAPDLHADVLAGRLSAHGAMVKAGYRPRTLTVRPDDPEAVVKSLRTHMEPAALVELLRLLADALSESLEERQGGLS